jgi:hypothetical protein
VTVPILFVDQYFGRTKNDFVNHSYIFIHPHDPTLNEPTNIHPYSSNNDVPKTKSLFAHKLEIHDGDKFYQEVAYKQILYSDDGDMSRTILMFVLKSGQSINTFRDGMKLLSDY